MFTLEELKSWGVVPRVHPNGFIQLDKPGTEGTVRLHIWPIAELPKQGSLHPVHDHVFDMQSEILKGVMTNRVFDFCEPPDPSVAVTVHELHVARYATPHDSTLVPTGDRGVLRLNSQIRIPAGGGYYLPAFALHESLVRVRPTVTLMTKTNIYKPHKPHVAVPVGMRVDNEYSRHAMSEAELWKIIEESL